MADADFTRGLWRFRRGPGFGRAVTLALLVHVALLGMLIVSIRWSVSRPQNVIRAVVITEPQAKPQEAPPPQAKPEQAETRKREEALRRQQEQAQQAEAERQRQAAVKAQQQEQDRKRKKEEARKKAAEERKRAAEAQRKKEEARKREQQEAARSIQKQLAAEESQREQAALDARAEAAKNQYIPVIKQRVERSWSRPPGFKKGFTCTVQVRLVPGGDVLAATVVQSSGNALFDRSAENAVYKASPLPVPSDPQLFEKDFREFNFEFKPEE